MKVWENNAEYCEAKENLINLINGFNLTEFSFYAYMNYYNKEMYENYKEQQFNNDVTNEEDNEEEEHMENNYKTVLTNLYMFQYDKDVIQAISNKLDEFEYDEDIIESKANAIQIVSALLRCNFMFGYGKGNPLLALQPQMANMLNQMSTTDLNIVYAIANNNAINKIDDYNNVFCSRMSDMTDEEFFIYTGFSDINIDDLSNENKTIFINRLNKLNNIFAIRYIDMYDENAEIVCNLLSKVKPEDKVSALIMSNVFKNNNKKIGKEKEKMLQSFTNKDIVRYCATVINEEYDELATIVDKKIHNISNEDLKFLLFVYANTPTCYREYQLGSLLTERIHCKNPCKEDIDFWYNKDSEAGKYVIEFSKEEIEKYSIRARQYDSIVDLFSMQIPIFPEPNIVEVEYGEPEEYEEAIVENYQEILDNMNKYKNFLHYIMDLGDTKDENLLKTIVHANKKYKTDGVDEKTQEYWEFINNYLKNRILNMKDFKPFVALSFVTDKDAPLSNAMFVRLEEAVIEKNNFRNPKPKNEMNTEFKDENER